jgi:histidine triad (HIT) family protein
MNCTECELIQKRKNIIYEDAAVVALLAEKPAVAGHIIVIPREHQPIIERVSDEVFARMFSVANKVAAVCFDVLQAHGTNMLINNGVAAGQKSTHTQIHVIPRRENDGLKIHWQSSKANEEELNATQMALQEELEKPKEEKKEEKKEEQPKEEKEDVITDDEDNYLLKQLERIP